MSVRKVARSRYIDPLNDFGFKLLFAREANKQFLIHFLNELLKGRKRIVDLVYNKNEVHGPQEDFRRTVFDLTCTTQEGEQFLIEMQRDYQEAFKDRAVFYTSSFIHESGPRGSARWDYQLSEVVLVALMNFAFRDTPPGQYIHRVHLSEERSRDIFYKKLGYIFIELSKFNKQPEELTTDLDRWLYIFRNMGKLAEIPETLNHGIFRRLFTVAEISNLSKEDYMRITREQKEMWDQYAAIESAKSLSREEGWGEGLEKGREEGREEGIEKGEERHKAAVVRKLLLKQFPLADIMELADATEAFVQEVKGRLT